MTVGVIINPGSGRGNGKGQRLAKALQNSGLSIHVLQNFSELDPAIRKCASDGVEDLYISSGDGTIQAILTQIIEQKPFTKFPRIGVLPHGTTNLTAIDLGLKLGSAEAEANFINKKRPTKFKTRNTLHILNPSGESARHGMTLGAGAAAVATRLTQTDFNDKGRKGQLAAARMLAGAMFKALTTKADRHDTSRIDRPHDMRISAGGAIKARGDHLMFIATTLEKQFFNTRPFWGGKHGAIRASAFPYPVPNLLRWTLPLMYGGENRKVPPGAMSFSSNSFEITCDETYVMDGEFFKGPFDTPLKVQAGPAIEFIVG